MTSNHLLHPMYTVVVDHRVTIYNENGTIIRLKFAFIFTDKLLRPVKREFEIKYKSTTLK